MTIAAERSSIDYFVNTTSPMDQMIVEFTGYPEHTAVLNDDIAALDSALRSDTADINIEHHGGLTPLSLAVALVRTRMVEHLIAAGADVNLYPRRQGLVAAAVAANKSSVKIMSLLIRARVQLNVRFAGESLCHLAASNPDPGVLTLLLAAGAPCNHGNFDEAMPIHVAANNENERVLALLLVPSGKSCSERFGEYGVTPALCAAANRNEHVLAMLIDHGVDCRISNYDGDCPIHVAARNPNAAVVRLLIAAGVDVNVTNAAKENALFLACSNPNEQVLDALLAAGAEWRNSKAATVAHVAARNSNETVVRRILGERCANVNARDRWGFTPLMIAARCGTSDVVSLLLDAGADVGATDVDYGHGVCHFACENAAIGVMSVLIAAGAPFGVDVLKKAIQKSNLVAVHALIGAGMDIAYEINTSPQLIMQRITGEMLELLIREGVDFRALDDDGRRMCHSATLTCLAVLFARGVDLNVADSSGKTVLVSSEGEELITLLAAGVDTASLDDSRYEFRNNRGLMAAVGRAVDNVPWRELAWACNRIAERQFELLRLRAFQVCVGLQSAELPALVSCEILAHAFVPLESLVAFHRVWAIVTKIKHFRD